MKEFRKFTNPLILNVIRGYYLSNGVLHHSNLSGEVTLDRIDTKDKFDLITRLANITDEQIVDIECEIDFVFFNNKNIQAENKTAIDVAVQTLKRLNNCLLSKSLDEKVEYPRPDYLEWTSHESAFIMKVGMVRTYVDCAKATLEAYHKKLKEDEDVNILIGKAITYLISKGKRCGVDFNFGNAIRLADECAAQLELYRIMTLNPEVDLSDVTWNTNHGHSFESVDISIINYFGSKLELK